MKMLSEKWVLILINAIFVIGFGLILLIVPIETIKSLIFVVGAFIAFAGLILIFGAFNYAKENKSMLFWMFQGLFNLVVGAVVMFYPEASIKFLLILAGLWAIVLGVYQFSVSVIPNLEIKGKNWHKINGIVAIIIGLLLMFAPELIMGLMLQIFGFLLLAIGGGMLYFAILLKRLGKIAKQEEGVEIIDIDEPSSDDEVTP